MRTVNCESAEPDGDGSRDRSGLILRVLKWAADQFASAGRWRLMRLDAGDLTDAQLADIGLTRQEVERAGWYWSS